MDQPAWSIVRDESALGFAECDGRRAEAVGNKTEDFKKQAVRAHQAIARNKDPLQTS